MVAVDPSAKSLTFHGFSGKPDLISTKKINSKDLSQSQFPAFRRQIEWGDGTWRAALAGPTAWPAKPRPRRGSSARRSLSSSGSDPGAPKAAGFGPCFHLPGFHLGTGVLSHSQITSRQNWEGGGGGLAVKKTVQTNLLKYCFKRTPKERCFSFGASIRAPMC